MDYLVSQISRLEKKTGLQLYAVGGCVRNILLNVPVKDYDFTTPSLPDEIEQKLKSLKGKTYKVGKKYGTIGFKDEKLGMIEITTFRVESYDENSRKPHVTFVDDLFKDLSRRDLTINSMAVDSAGNLYDYSDGECHLQNRIIACVKDPLARFNEDPLRMLRAIRFQVQLHGKMVDNVENAIKKLSYKILTISKERVVIELDKMFKIDENWSLERLLQTHLFHVLFMEVGTIDYHDDEKNFQIYCSIIKQLNKNTILSKEDKAWNMLLRGITNLIVKDENDVSKRMVVYMELVKKYSQYFKFSNVRQKILMDVPIL